MKINAEKQAGIYDSAAALFIKLPGMGEYAATDLLMDMMFACSTAVIFYLAIRVKYRPDTVIKLALLLQAYLFFITIYYGSLTLTLLRNTIGVFFAMVLVDLWVRRNDFIVYDSILILFVLFSAANVLMGCGRFLRPTCLGRGPT